MIRHEQKTQFGVRNRFVDHPELRRSATVRSLLQNAEKYLRLGFDDPSIDDSVLFRAMNACGKELHRKKSSRVRKSARDLKRLRELQRRLVEFIVQRNVGLVYDMLKRTRVAGIDRDELVSEGLWTLFKAVTSFDPWRGYRFSTYACTSILRSFVSLARKRRRDHQAMTVLRDRFEPVRDDVENASDLDLQLAADRVGRVLKHNSARLTDLERFVIERRLLHDPHVKADTLSQVGDLVDLSKERVRQVQLAAITKLQQALAEHYDDPDGESMDEEPSRYATSPSASGRNGTAAA